MADQGFKSALNSDIDAKVTTNGANENTGSRVNACLSNMADTIFGRGGHHSAYQAGLKLNYKDTVTHLNQIWEWQGTETTSTNWATDSSDFISIGTAPAYVAAQIPKRYKWVGTGGGATGTVIANTLGVTINVTNPGAGDYLFTAASGNPFATDKTTVTFTIIDESNPLVARVFYMDDTQIRIRVFDSTTGSDMDPAAYLIMIEVEP